MKIIKRDPNRDTNGPSPQGAQLEVLLQSWRVQGMGKGRSIVELSRRYVVSLGEAKRAVHFSETWADVRERDEKFHEELEKALPQVLAELEAEHKST